VNFLNVGPLELTVILIIAIFLIGPKRMIEVSRTIARLARQLRKYSADFTSTLQAEVAATERAAGESPQEVIQSITEPFTTLQAELRATEHETRQALTSLVGGAAEPIQNELGATEHETRQALTSLVGGAAEPIQNEPGATEHETRQALDKAGQDGTNDPSTSSGRDEPTQEN
jgi:Sec-independent protein translocase protein TatA